ncbi:MAG: LacI family DNA-binding transcriptional regulator [Verrucomicrobia bacterium]|nr:LacI family DNA-binding transcriptional regulator [Verrucomicrobiota bacterium]
MKAIRQIDIARQLKVSRSTVAAALNPGSPTKLRPRLKQRIQAAARQMVYRPHRYAQIMRNGKTGLIGIIRSSVPASTRLKLDRCACKGVIASGYEPFSKDVDWVEHPSEVGGIIDTLLDAHVEGVLFLGISSTLSAQQIERLRRCKIPVVSVNGIVLPGVAQVRNDAHQGMFELTRHVLRLGHRRPLMLTRLPTTITSAQWRDPNFNWTVAQRSLGFSKAVVEAGGLVRHADKLFQSLGVKPPRPAPGGPNADIEAEVVIESPEGDWNDLFHAGKAAMQKILRRPQLPSVVMCHNDFWAIGALTACAEAGVGVPDDISLTGFDGLLISEYGNIPLTTALQPTEAMANQAVQLLTDLVATGKNYKTGAHASLPYQIVSRKSCARPA